MMKKAIMMIVSVLLLAACATLTPEQRAAREAELKAAVGEQQYRININSMTPMRGVTHTVFDFWLKVDGNTVTCTLPYVGRDDIPHPKTPAEFHMDSKLDFEAEIQNYVLALQPEKQRAIISFSTIDAATKYDFKIILDNTGRARVHVDPEDRDFIDYEGYIAKL